MRNLTKAPNLLALREAYGWSQQETADRIGISRSYYAMLEVGGREPSVAAAKKIARVFRLDWYTFFTHEKTG
ncbi:MAG: helix-turn-helix transcriptional regulator [Oscillospiraceae bacterium]|nr:helix-turn-helix transcriptional regulator [Oscillospiraceae bacterium]